MSVTGHKNIASLESYAKGPTVDQRAKMSAILANYTETNQEDNEVAVLEQRSVPTNVANLELRSMRNITSSLLAGAHFHGPVTFNMNIHN